MNLALTLTAGALLLAVAALAAQAWSALRSRPSSSLIGATVVVNTHPDDRTFRGVVLAEHADRITLHQAFVVLEGGSDRPVAGTVHVPRAAFTHVQQIEG